jgi:hypothetical protein
MRPHRAIVLITIALAAACIDTSGPDTSRLFVNPVLDSLFVGDTVPALEVVYVNASGDTQPPGPVRWFSSARDTLHVDSVTGQLVGKRRGIAILTAQARGVYGSALVAVSNPLDVSLLLDTLYLMPGDNFPVQYQLLSRDGPPPPVSFNAASNAVFSIDPATGVITAGTAGGPLPFTVQADTASRTGWVEVVNLTDTLGGKTYLSVFGTFVRRLNADSMRAVNYRRAGDTATFRMNPVVIRQGTLVESVVITLRDSIAAPGVFEIDNLSEEEAFGAGFDAICRPLRPWGLWSSRAFGPTVTALSIGGGTITISSVQDIPGRPAKAISGWFYFQAQRTDFGDDLLGVLPVRGSFVVPLITDTRHNC